MPPHAPDLLNLLAGEQAALALRALRLCHHSARSGGQRRLLLGFRHQARQLSVV